MSDSQQQSKASFVFVRDEPKMFEAPDWIPNKSRLYHILNETYRDIRKAQGHIRAEKIIKEWLDLLVDFGMAVAVDAHNQAVERAQEVQQKIVESAEVEPKKPHPLSREARAARAAAKAG